MLILLERPATTQKFGLLARKDGEYKRPVIGEIIDFRIEDFMPQSVLTTLMMPNFVGKLPDIPDIGQTNQYCAATFNVISPISEKEAHNLLATNQYLLLPHDSRSDFWQYTHAPWWYFTVVIDKYDGFIKAPLRPRPGEPSPDEADERIDEFTENRGKIEVLAPSTLEKWKQAVVHEDYIKRLNQI